MPLQDEAGRLAALAEYGVTAPLDDAGFGRLVLLAASMFNAPIALVSLVEAERQLFAARVGVNVCETSREASFCAHALGSDQLLIVPDAHRDPRFHDNSLVTGSPYIRFYAGCPLMSPLGYVVGTLCIIDTEPRDGLTAKEAGDLRDLASMVLDKLENRRLALACRAAQERFESLAADIEDGLICVDGSGRITLWNAAVQAKLGIPAAQARGAELDAVLPGPLMPALRALGADATPDQATATLRVALPTADGGVRHWDARLTRRRENARNAYRVLLGRPLDD